MKLQIGGKVYLSFNLCKQIKYTYYIQFKFTYNGLKIQHSSAYFSVWTLTLMVLFLSLLYNLKKSTNFISISALTGWRPLSGCLFPRREYDTTNATKHDNCAHYCLQRNSGQSTSGKRQNVRFDALVLKLIYLFSQVGRIHGVYEYTYFFEKRSSCAIISITTSEATVVEVISSYKLLCTSAHQVHR